MSSINIGSAWGGEKVLNGGGGEGKGSQYMTFYSAGLYVEPSEPSAPPVVPGLEDLIQYITDLDVISFESKAPLLKAITPSGDRQYYIASPKELTPAIKARLLEEFKRVTNVDAANLRLYALTDTNSQSTFILPEFAKLKKRDQMTILYHEAYWLNHPDATYNEVVKAEMAFQAALSTPDNPTRVLDFVTSSGLASELEIAAAELKLDLSSESLDGLVDTDANGQYIKFSTLLGDSFMKCAMSTYKIGDPRYAQANPGVNEVTTRNADERHNSGSYSPNTGIYFSSSGSCQPVLVSNLYKLTTKYPHSRILRRLQKYAEQSSYLIYSLFLTDGQEGVYRAYTSGWSDYDCRMYLQDSVKPKADNLLCQFTTDSYRSDGGWFSGGTKTLSAWGKVPFADAIKKEEW